MGKGAYGIVASAKNELDGNLIAIKKIEQAFEQKVESLRNLRELKILRHLDHENIIKIKNILLPLSR